MILEYLWGILNDPIFVAVVFGTVAYFARKHWDTRDMRQSLTRILCNELRENHRLIVTMRSRGLSNHVMVINDVYVGLLTSGNIRYLEKHQPDLYDLYRAMNKDDPNMLKLLRSKLHDLESST